MSGTHKYVCSQSLKKASFGGPNLLVFVSPGMKNYTPSGANCWKQMSGDARSEPLLALLKANSMTSFIEKSFKERSAADKCD